MKCRSCLKRLEPDGKFCTGCGVEAIIDEAQRLNSPGVSFLPEAFAESTYQFASALVEDPFFHNSFVNYILTMNVNATKQGHLRAQLVADARDYTRLYEGCFEHLLWCAISLATDSYFEEKSKVYGWSAADEEDVRSAWYNLVAKAFIPEATENDLKQDDQKHDLYETWQERFARQMEAESMTVEEIEAAIRRHKANR